MVILSLFAAVNLVSAAGLVPCGGPGEKSCDLCFLFSMIKKVLDFTLAIVIPSIAALIILIGGFNLLANRGNPETIAKTKSVLLTAAIGLVIVFGGWVVVNTTLSALGVTAWEGTEGKWWKFSLTCESPSAYGEGDIEVCPGGLTDDAPE